MVVSNLFLLHVIASRDSGEAISSFERGDCFGPLRENTALAMTESGYSLTHCAASAARRTISFSLTFAWRNCVSNFSNASWSRLGL